MRMLPEEYRISPGKFPNHANARVRSASPATIASTPHTMRKMLTGCRMVWKRIAVAFHCGASGRLHLLLEHHRHLIHAPIHSREALVHRIRQSTGGFPLELVLARGEFAGEEMSAKKFRCYCGIPSWNGRDCNTSVRIVKSSIDPMCLMRRFLSSVRICWQSTIDSRGRPATPALSNTSLG